METLKDILSKLGLFSFIKTFHILWVERKHKKIGFYRFFLDQKKILEQQKKEIKKYNQKEENIILFLVPETERINGGILSVFSLCCESRRFKDIHQAEVLLATYPGKVSYYQNKAFVNDEKVFSFSLVMEHFTHLKSLILHIPECSSFDIIKNLSKKNLTLLRKIPYVHINILNQNAMLMPSPKKTSFIKNFCDKLTQTTAHNRCCNQETSNYYQTPVHLFSVGVDKSNYVYTEWKNKEDILIVSPDSHPLKHKILELIKQNMPHVEQIIIQNLKYEDFKKLISRAKFSLTFGEGFDGYYIEPTFSGSIGFTVYNSKFFPSPLFKDFFGIYKDYTQLKNAISQDMKKIDTNTSLREQTLKHAYEQLSSIYSFNGYLKNIECFYEGKYMFLPKD